MARTSYSDKTGLRRGAWTPEEDRRLSAYIKRYGHWNWLQIPKFAGLSRCGKSCRLRWMNYLRPNIKRGNYTKEEDELIINLHQALGSRWSAISAKLPGRTDNEIKNHWHTHLKKGSKRKSILVKEAKQKPMESSLILNASEPIILESSAILPMLQQQSCEFSSSSTDSEAVIIDNLIINESVLSPETFLDFDGNFWTEPFWVTDSQTPENTSSILVDPTLIFPLSPPGETFFYPYDLYNPNEMDGFIYY